MSSLGFWPLYFKDTCTQIKINKPLKSKFEWEKSPQALADPEVSFGIVGEGLVQANSMEDHFHCEKGLDMRERSSSGAQSSLRKLQAR